MSEIVRQEDDGSFTIKLYGDPEAVKTEQDLEWTYIHTISVQALERIVEEGRQILMDMGIRNLMRETA